VLYYRCYNTAAAATVTVDTNVDTGTIYHTVLQSLDPVSGMTCHTQTVSKHTEYNTVSFLPTGYDLVLL